MPEPRMTSGKFPEAVERHRQLWAGIAAGGMGTLNIIPPGSTFDVVRARRDAAEDVEAVRSWHRPSLEGKETIWIAHRGCYEQRGIHGVYRTAGAAKAAFPADWVWEGSDEDGWSNGLDWGDAVDIEQYEVKDD